ncbi:MAG: amylo-alpha-1,6-glucosidase [Kiritimatiellia bacterium]|jgi:starch synthase (maltosyl-transferring)
MKQTPDPGSSLLAHVGDVIDFTLRIHGARPGRASLRTTLGGARIRRREIVEAADAGRPALALEWRDVPMQEVEPGVHRVRIPLAEVGVLRAKACFFPAGGGKPEWPQGADVRIKAAPAWTCRGASMYTAFVRQFGDNCEKERAPEPPFDVKALDRADWTVIPPEGTFRDLIPRLDAILGQARFRILQLLPIHPVPTTFARMGRYGSPFAGTDFLAVNPALAEFDAAATPLDQFHELVDAVHARGGRLFLDLPANHTGWASTLQTHHPDWFRRGGDGRFISPGAWGTIWEDLVELDYANPGLRSFMAGVFEFWCRQGVDGFRCDAGYMVPADVWRYIVARVRRQFPDTVFLLEGLGGKISVTHALLAEEGLDWAYSEIFQTEDRSAFERYLPGALAMSAEAGPLVHFAETHDNNRLAARSPTYSRMRVAVAALLSHQGCFGITNGVEWFADEKVNVHGASALRWGASENQMPELARLNALLASHPAFGPHVAVRLVQRRGGNSLAIVRTPPRAAQARPLLALANLDDQHRQPVSWSAMDFPGARDVYDLLGGNVRRLPEPDAGHCTLMLEPGEVLCLAETAAELDALGAHLAKKPPFLLDAVRHQTLRATALAMHQALTRGRPLGEHEDVDRLAALLADDPLALLSEIAGADAMPPATEITLPDDVSRVVMVPPGHFIIVRCAHPFRCAVESADGRILAGAVACASARGDYFAVLLPEEADTSAQRDARLRAQMHVPGGKGCERLAVGLCLLPEATPATPTVRSAYTGMEVLNEDFRALLSNGRGAMAHVRAKWGEVRTQYDALLAANPHPTVPCDRHVLFTRCRLWIVHQGFSIELDASCLTQFACVAGTGVATWRFKPPVGTGRSIDLLLTLTLHREQNRTTLELHRFPGGNDPAWLDDESAVQVIFRPDIESRSFHHKTKAYAGPERDWPGRIRQIPGGFEFRPHGLPGLSMTLSDGAYTPEPEWHYAIGHPDDAARGLDGQSDLYSPGWFSTQLEGGESRVLDAVCLVATEEAPPRAVETNGAPRRRHADDDKPTPLRKALSLALRDYIVRRDELMTVIAGYPWFLDWGRDTFIVMRGMVADGLYDESLGIVRKFGQFESGGTLPNMITGNDASNRDTSDAPLWYIVATRELAEKAGAARVLDADCGGRTVRQVMIDIAKGYCRGTPNGIRVDEASGLVYSPSHYTWMDTNHPAGTPRAGYPVEIQALWIAALDAVAALDPGGPWAALAARARQSFAERFWLEDRGHLSDCLHTDRFRPASEARADDHLRCNQIFALTLGTLEDKQRARRTLRSTARLLVPGGIRTLAPGLVKYHLPVHRDGALLNDPSRPYWGRYEGDEDTRRKPAYHNGTAWTWPFPSYAEALVKVYGRSAEPTARALVASAAALMERGCIGQLPEILDGDAPHHERGCDAQAWGVSEFLRLAILLDL